MYRIILGYQLEPSATSYFCSVQSIRFSESYALNSYFIPLPEIFCLFCTQTPLHYQSSPLNAPTTLSLGPLTSHTSSLFGPAFSLSSFCLYLSSTNSRFRLAAFDLMRMQNQKSDQCSEQSRI